MRKNMAYDYSKLLVDVEAWAHASVKGGWINQQQALSLIVEPDSSANELFSNNDRPLVVAFMGGTGVGKSSLLNKLSGQAIARTGVERPTSMEVTLYHHQQLSLKQLEDKFPLQNIQLSQHADSINQQVVWVDMPDFDSTEEKNKDIVMQWLPYVDVLIYVVSPERYRDNKAWQLLLAEGASHAWLFVMNQWDRGDSSQFDDFKQQLSKAGFNDPIIYKTISHLEAIEGEDELAQLQESISSLASENTIEQLENRGVQQRRDAIKQKVQQCFMLLGKQQGFSELAESQRIRWIAARSQLIQGFEWPVKQLAVIYSKKAVVIEQNSVKLWDEWAQNRFDDYLDELILTADQNGFPSMPLRKQLLECRVKAEKHIQAETELACRKALIDPGNIIQRAILKIAKISELILPLIAMGIVGFQVFQGYYDSAVTEQAFLGVNFAVHSSLLILISWLLPFFIGKKMQPSLEKAAFKGLNFGVGTAMAMIDKDISQALMGFKNEHQAMVDSLEMFVARCDTNDDRQELIVESEQLRRMLVKD